jgi:hypothetical protein
MKIFKLNGVEIQCHYSDLFKDQEEVSLNKPLDSEIFEVLVGIDLTRKDKNGNWIWPFTIKMTNVALGVKAYPTIQEVYIDLTKP